MKIPTTFFPILCLLLTATPSAVGQQLANEAAETTKVIPEANTRLDKNENRGKIKLRNGSEVKGRITQTADNSFSLTDEKTGAEDGYKLYRRSVTEWQRVEQEDKDRHRRRSCGSDFRRDVRIWLYAHLGRLTRATFCATRATKQHV